MNVVMLI